MTTRYLMQRGLWLQAGASDTRTAIYQPQQRWVSTDGNQSGVLLITPFSVSSDATLFIEGSNTDDGWFVVANVTASASGVVPIGLVSSYPQSDGSGFLWRRLRWVWRANGSGTLADQFICFQIQVVLKP